ncbi:phage protein NinX family protein [Morganella morganii]|uniref:phage protein NinX family protein n=1 Tax=Morganella morganii TaxID=582 RepID=UPI003EBE3FBF
MNKYHDKSDFEINKAVAECKYGIGCTGKTQGGDVIVFTDSFTAVFDPCNNPADAMPIVFDNGISLISDWNEIGVWGATYQPWWTSENKNPLRAAMEVFLMMKEAENE